MGKIINKLKMMVGAALMIAGVTGASLPVMADTAADSAGDGVNSIMPDGTANDLTGTIKDIINVVIFVVGIIAVVMVILGGIQYSTSQGDAAKVKKAKDTILYGIIGLVVAILAFAIVNFVLNSVFK